MALDLTGDLFSSYSRARREDPKTSHAAAKSVQEFAASHFGIIVYALKSHGPMTIDEIAIKTKLSHVAIARRMTELQRINATEPTGTTRAGVSGRQQRVWRAL